MSKMELDSIQLVFTQDLDYELDEIANELISKLDEARLMTKEEMREEIISALNKNKEEIPKEIGNKIDEQLKGVKRIDTKTSKIVITEHGIDIGIETEEDEGVKEKIEKYLKENEIKYECENNYVLVIEDSEELFNIPIKEAIGEYESIFSLEGEEGSLMVKIDDKIRIKSESQKSLQNLMEGD